MALTAAETIAKSSGDLYEAPAGTAAPDVADIGDMAALELAGWVHVGWVDEDGPQPAGFEGETTKHYGWNRIAPARATTRRTEPEISVGLLQWNTENLQRYFPGATADALTETVTVPEDVVTAEKAVLITVTDGDKTIAMWVSKATVRGGDSFEFPGDGLTPIPVVYDVLGGEVPWVQFVGIEVAA